MTNHPLPTKLDLDHPLRHDVRNIRVDGVLIEEAVKLDQNAGWVHAYSTPMQFDENGEAIMVLHTGHVTFDWLANAQQFWNDCGGAA